MNVVDTNPGDGAYNPDGIIVVDANTSDASHFAVGTFTGNGTQRTLNGKEVFDKGLFFYDLVYDADRPELFLKATPHRVSGPGQPVRIRYDATWNVPEPEITCVVSSKNKLVGFTIGNDMSSRDIEGENPLYLPQAKVYRQCAGLGPCITLLESMPAREDTGIKLQIERDGEVVFEGNSGVSEMHRTFEDLIGYLCREQEFPNGVFLMTGTGIVPDSDFTLNAGDVVHITICGIGTLTNPVVQDA